MAQCLMPVRVFQGSTVFNGTAASLLASWPARPGLAWTGLASTARPTQENSPECGKLSNSEFETGIVTSGGMWRKCVCCRPRVMPKKTMHI